MIDRLVKTIATALLIVAFVPPASAAAHGADAESSSNYRTRITAITPQRAGLSVRVIDTGGRLELTNDTGEEVVVLGYQEEPYLRIGPAGVFENVRSPATYLNSTRDGLAPIPEGTDALASPDWRLVSTSSTTSWHDHRSHWMSPLPPPAVQANSDQTFVIYDRWVVPLLIGGQRVEVVGDLAWVPPPPRTGLLLAALVGCILLSILMQMRWWRPVAIIVLVSGLTLDAIATFGYFRVSGESMSNRLWLFVYTVLIAVAALRMLTQFRRGISHPPLSMGGAGILLVMMGGLDHFDVLSNSQITYGLPADFARAAAVVELCIGAALVVTFAAAVRRRPGVAEQIPDPRVAAT